MPTIIRRILEAPFASGKQFEGNRQVLLGADTSE
ncbi:hypothetical protein HNR46_000456 [Haloferula luteola]|uniref:Uncharacterized protein n=1 Tax=Haloferula luteola TaxID=595692 RepID=A0A840UWS5_9BACT|nr:hypothetical protein [Haloferula luteola]